MDTQEYNYLKNSDFEENVIYEFKHVLGWTFESTVERASLNAPFYTTNRTEQQFKACTLKCKKNKPINQWKS